MQETSPYLLQHAYNPVDWHPWGEEALATARRLDRPIFLSIGYSACHWCHVMEHESFEDPEIADRMNRNFVNIKVDREERPDLDQVYMNAVTALTGRGGWPMSVFLTPELKPFFGGTYWPPQSRMGMTGFADVLERVHEAWVERRDEVDRGAESLTAAVVRMGESDAASEPLDRALLQSARQTRLRSADRIHGGFGGAPKFPHPMDLRLLLRLSKRFDDAEALEFVALSLDKMAAGGIYDHLGGGFHRYSTDARWLVPHFEKMLYDNALLTSTYVEAFQATGERRYAQVAGQTLDYVLREMTHPDGGFYSTQDADSEGEEGRFFVWTQPEVDAALPAEESRVFCYCYDVTPQGNWERKTILNRVKTSAQASRVLGLSESDLDAILSRCRQVLFDRRAARVPPSRDEKIIASWNGLMIAAMAQAARALDEPRFAAAAVRAADFVIERMRLPQGRLAHSFKDGRAPLNAYLDDYAAIVDALAETYQTTFDARFLDASTALAEDLLGRFGDDRDGGFYYTSHDHEQLIARNRDVHDNATPSGSGLAAYALGRLSRLTGRSDLDERARRALTALSGEMGRVSMAMGQSLLALDDLLGPSYEIVIADGSNRDELAEALRAVRRRYLPGTVVAGRAPHLSESDIASVLGPVTGGKTSIDDRPTLYVCERGTCRAPVSGAPAIAALVRML